MFTGYSLRTKQPNNAAGIVLGDERSDGKHDSHDGSWWDDKGGLGCFYERT